MKCSSQRAVTHHACNPNKIVTTKPVRNPLPTNTVLEPDSVYSADSPQDVTYVVECRGYEWTAKGYILVVGVNEGIICGREE